MYLQCTLSVGLTDVPLELSLMMMRLERIDLSYNNLTDSSFPPTFSNLKLLVELNVTGNQLTQIPKAVLSLHRLKRLYAGRNDLPVALQISS